MKDWKQFSATLGGKMRNRIIIDVPFEPYLATRSDDGTVTWGVWSCSGDDPLRLLCRTMLAANMADGPLQVVDGAGTPVLFAYTLSSIATWEEVIVRVEPDPDAEANDDHPTALPLFDLLDPHYPGDQP